MFWLKKAVSFWLMPLPLSLLLLVAGLVLLALGRSRPPVGQSSAPPRSRARRCGAGSLVIGTLLLLIFGNVWISEHLLRPLEATYPPIPELKPGAPLPRGLAGCRFVVVLGSGHSDLPDWPATSQLQTAGLGRLIEGLRLLRVLPQARLIVSGPGAPGAPTHASVLARAAESLGVEPSAILRIEHARDTEEEAAAVHRLVGSARVALVTSAFHMRRAARLFAREGVAFVPCPTDFSARPREGVGVGDLLWDTESLGRSTQAVHERLGLTWLTLRSALGGRR